MRVCVASGVKCTDMCRIPDCEIKKINRLIVESDYKEKADDPAEELDDYGIQANSERLVRSYCTER